MSDADRAADIIAKMSLDDKIALACGDFGAVAHLGLPALSFTDGGNGVRVTGDATAFPVCVSLAASFDEQLAYRFGSAVGEETRSAGHNVLLGPALDIARTPLAGRLPEAFGEDPYLPPPWERPTSGVSSGTSWPWSSTSWSTTSRPAGPGPAGRHRTGAGGRRPRLPPGLGRDLLPAVPARPRRGRSGLGHGVVQPGQRLLRLPAPGTDRHAERPVGMGGVRRPRLHVRGARSARGRAGGPGPPGARHRRGTNAGRLHQRTRQPGQARRRGHADGRHHGPA